MGGDRRHREVRGAVACVSAGAYAEAVVAEIAGEDGVGLPIYGRVGEGVTGAAGGDEGVEGLLARPFRPERL
jgi:hypothetical protein